MTIRRPSLAALPVLVALAGCHSAAEKADAYEARYDQMMAAKAYPAALYFMKKSVAEDDNTPRRWLKLASVQNLAGQPAAAALSYQRALDLEPDNVDALQNLAILSVRGEQFDMAQRYIEPLLALNPNDPAGLLASAAVAFRQRRMEDAAGLADKIIATLPDRPDGYLLKSRVMDAHRQTRAAVAMLEQRAAQVQDPDLLTQLMNLYRKLGDQAGIRATAIRLMPLYPNDPRYAFESARAFRARGRSDRADAIIAHIVRQFGRSPQVMVAVARYWQDTAPAQARDRIVALAGAAPPAVRSALADQLIAAGDAARAVQLLAPLAPARVTPQNVDGQAHMARALLAADRYPDAHAKVDAILRYDPDNPDGLVVRARLRLHEGHLNAALADAQRASSTDDSNQTAALLVPEIYAKLGNQLLAGNAFGTARQHFPDSVAVLQAEIDWLLAQNRDEEAAQRASAFREAHRRSDEADRIYAATCARTKAPLCRGEVPMLARLAS